MPDKQRPVIGDIQGAPELRPQASPIDTYFQPAARTVQQPAETNPVLQLAQSLRTLQPEFEKTIGQFDKAQELNKHADLAQGETDALQSQVTAAEYQKAHPEFQDWNPWRKIGYERGYLKNQAHNFMLDLNNGYVGSAASATDDPKVFNDYVNQKTNAFLQSVNPSQYNPMSLTVLAPEIQSAVNNLTAQHVQQRAVQLTQDNKDQFQQSFRNQLSDYYQNAHGLVATALDQYKLVHPQATQEDLNGVVDKTLQGLQSDNVMGAQKLLTNAYLTGIPFKDANQLAVSAAKDFMEKVHDTDGVISSFLGKIPTSKGNTLVNSPLADKELTSATNAISSAEWTNEQREFHKQTVEEKKWVNSYVGNAQAAVIANPQYNLKDTLDTLNSKGHPEEAKALFEFQRKVQDNQNNPIPDAQTQVKFHNEATKPGSDITKWGAVVGKPGGITVSDYTSGLKFSKQVNDDVKRDESFRDFYGNIMGQAQHNISESLKPTQLEASMPKKPGQIPRSVQALQDYQTSYRAWYNDYTQKHPGKQPSAYDAQQWSDKAQADIIKKFQPVNDSGNSQKHESPPPKQGLNIFGVNPFDPSTYPWSPHHQEQQPGKPTHQVNANDIFKNKQQIREWMDEDIKTGGKGGPLHFYMQTNHIPNTVKNRTEVLKRFWQDFKGN